MYIDEEDFKKTSCNKKYNKKLHDEFIKRFQLNYCNVRETCRQMHITTPTFYNWKKSYPLFNADIERVKGIIDDNMYDFVMPKYYEAIECGEAWAIQRWMDAKKIFKPDDVKRMEHKLDFLVDD